MSLKPSCFHGFVCSKGILISNFTTQTVWTLKYEAYHPLFFNVPGTPSLIVVEVENGESLTLSKYYGKFCRGSTYFPWYLIHLSLGFDSAKFL